MLRRLIKWPIIIRSSIQPIFLFIRLILSSALLPICFYRKAERILHSIVPIIFLTYDKIRLYVQKYACLSASHRRNFQMYILRPLETFRPRPLSHNFSYHLKYQKYIEDTIFVLLYDYNSMETIWGFSNPYVEDSRRRTS